MKKILLATTLLASTATVASAETGVTVSGYGRFGLNYDSSADDVVSTNSTTTISSRLRINIDGRTETDAGVTFGGRLRLQSTNGEAAGTNAAAFFAAYEGFRLEVGNVNGAVDSAGLIYASEMGFEDSSFGDARSAFAAYTTNAGVAPGVGVFASYTMGDLTGRISYITDDQVTNAGVEEVAVSFDYASGPFSVSLAAAQDAASIKGNDIYFVGAAYAINDAATVGLNYIKEDTQSGGASAGDRTITLYGNYTMGATTLRAYVANNDAAANKDDTAYGLGADYDLGGARLSGSIQSGYDGETLADVGVRFDF